MVFVNLNDTELFQTTKYLNYFSKYKNTNPRLLLEALQTVYNSNQYPLSVVLDSFIYNSSYPLINVRLKNNNTVELTQVSEHTLHIIILYIA